MSWEMESRRSIKARMLALTSLSFGFSLISSSFGFFYVKVFLNIYKVDENWFQIAQTLFLVWNAINDPLFAYLQDTTNFRFSRTRRESVLYVAPFFALSFLVPWFPWADNSSTKAWITGLHLITSLCLWDTMFTYVGLAYCCLFTELSSDNEVRIKLVQYTQIGSLIGSSSIFILQYMSHQLDSFTAFQGTSIIIATVSFLLMFYCGKYAYTERELVSMSDPHDGSTMTKKSQDYSYFTLTKQVFSSKDFLAFVSMNFFQEFHRTFLTNFFAIFADQLIVKDAISPLTRSIFYSGSSTAAKILTIVGTPVMRRYGYYNVIRYSQLMLIILGFIYYFTGPINHWILMVFMILDSCTTDGVYSMFSLALSDIADKDVARYSRRHPMTSMIYGCNALVVKPAISLSPMFVVAVLNSHGYRDMKEGILDPTQHGNLNAVMFTLICLFPFVIGCIQYVAWSFYTIRQSKTLDMTLILSGEVQNI